jgi:hypothetical protein
MLTLGSEDHRGDESRRKEWLAPALSVLVFRATANGVTSTTDAAIATAAAAVERRPSMRWSRAGGRRNRHDFLCRSPTDI